MNLLAAAALGGVLATGQTAPSNDSQAQEFIQNLLGPVVEEMKGSMSRQVEMTRRLNGQIVEEVKFKDASLQEVVAFLTQTSKELDQHERPLNFIVLPAAAEEAKGKTVTVDFRAMPIGQVLRYSMEMLGLGYRLDEYAVVITPQLSVARPPMIHSPQGTLPAQPVR